LRYQAGDSATLFTIEQRVFTDWYPFRIFNVGGAVFFDAGRTWGHDPLQGTNHGWLRDVGFGLRIGSSRSGLGRMLHVDLAYPLDGGADISNVQIVIESRTGF
jgi:outer membrane translocation and assembly module TamA